MIHVKTNTPPMPARRAALRTAGLALGLAGAMLAALPALAQNGGKPQSLPTVTLSAGMHNIRAEVARTFEQRQIGLMHRPAMGTNDGMIFVFEEPATQCFWMKNTLIPLDAAFLADDGTIVNIEAMKPLSEASHCSAKPVRYVLEMNLGWFAKRGIKPGMKIGGIAR